MEGLRMSIGFAILPTAVECQRTKWRRVSLLSPTRATNRLP